MQRFNDTGSRQWRIVIRVKFLPTISGQASILDTFKVLSFGNSKPNQLGNGVFSSCGVNATRSRHVRLGAGIEKILGVPGPCRSPFGVRGAFEASAWEYRLLDLGPRRHIDKITSDQREGNDRIVDLPCETDISWTHVYHMPSADSRRWYQPKTSARISGGRRDIGHVSLTNEEIWGIASQRVSVSLQDEFGCLGSCCSRQVHRQRGAREGGVHAARHAAILTTYHPRYENRYPSDDWATVPAGDKPESTKWLQRYTGFCRQKGGNKGRSAWVLGARAGCVSGW